MRLKFILLLFIFLVSYSLSYSQGSKFDKVFDETSKVLLSSNPEKALRNTAYLYEISTNNVERIKASMLRATLLRQHGMRNEAVRALKRADSLAVLDKNYNLQARINGFLSTIYREYEIYSLGKVYLQRAITASKKIQDKNEKYKFQGTLSQEIAYYAMYNSNFSKAIQDLKAGKKKFELADSSIDKNFHIAVNDELIGKNYLSLQKIDSALVYFQKAEKELSESESSNSPLKGFIFNGFGNVYARTGDDKKALLNYQKAEEIAEASDFFTLKQELYTSLMQFYKKTDYKKYIKYNELNLKLKKDEEDSRKSNTDELIKTLREEQKNNQSKNDQSKIIIALGCFIFIVLIIMLVYVFRRKKDYIKPEAVSENNDVMEIEEDLTPKQESSKEYMSEATESAILEKIQKLEESHFYLDKDISLNYVAVKLSINQRYLSYVINKNKSIDFAGYINELRIHYITDRLRNDSNFLKYKISFLADLCGFSSHSRFTTTFKKVTGVSPLTFITDLQEQRDEEKKEL
ncbi:AraC-type DNA-binding protein [Flavobacterium phragmitis]|uniref:AraC-type DNA-binding protein n=1 Tax=Flavobacterium phragmitis TaxID=739143 RepID=A0A1I1XYP3_9FLAO|nr:AraC-type DNA-binding protein [Flavobacterium phragmitis]